MLEKETALRAHAQPSGRPRAYVETQEKKIQEKRKKKEEEEDAFSSVSAKPTYLCP